MRWETTEAMLESAKKFAAYEDDLAVKSAGESSYFRHKGMADLLRVMSEKIKSK